VNEVTGYFVKYGGSILGCFPTEQAAIDKGNSLPFKTSSDPFMNYGTFTILYGRVLIEGETIVKGMEGLRTIKLIFKERK